MTISQINVKTLIDIIKTDLQKIKSAGGTYYSDPVVKRGLYGPDNVTDACFICYDIAEIEIIEILLNDNAETRLHVDFIGFVDVDPQNENYDPIDNLVRDFIKWLFSSDFTYNEGATVGELLRFDGTNNDPKAMFVCRVQVLYKFALSSP